MVKKIDELTDTPKDPNSPESQKFLWALYKRIRARNDELREILKKWKEEDREDENKRNQ